jgi:hypothetical protein
LNWNLRVTTSKRPSTRRKPAGNTALQALAKKRSAGAANPKAGSGLAHPQSRWQRAIRYTWDKNRGRG